MMEVSIILGKVKINLRTLRVWFVYKLETKVIID